MSKTPKVKFARLVNAMDLPLPEYQTEMAAGMDLRSAIDMEIGPGHRELFPTGLAVELPQGYEGQIRPRSGLAAKHGITVLNSPGTIDADFRGEIVVILINHGPHNVKISRGDRIAQFVVAPVARCDIVETTLEKHKATMRGTGGFGSTGKR